ncbi:hypothetical protein NECID01_1493 [Nematocida sp. AWRm77]|nr:hypothetical protein NECID01_1493 [Nematocida sp. AWRm77]
MLSVFLSQAGFDSRTIMHPSKKEKALLIEEANGQGKQIEDEYAWPSQTARSRIVLYSKLGPALSPEKERNEVVLAWLLSNMGGSSVDIQYTITVFSNNTTALNQAIKQFTQENEKGGCVGVEGLTLMVDWRNNTSLGLALQLVPGLSRLKLSIAPFYSTITLESTSLISAIILCKSLKALKITWAFLNTEEVSRIVESLPNIEQLSLTCDIIDPPVAESDQACTQLEILKMYGMP